MRTRSPTGLPAMNASATDTEAEGPVAPDPTTDAGQRLLRLQVDILIGHLPGMVLGTTVLSSGAALILLHQGMGRWQVALWWAAMAAYSAARLLLWRVLRRQATTAASATRRARLLTLSSGLAGALWGALSWFFFTPQDPLSIALVVAILCGILSSSTQSIGAYWPAHAAFALPCTLPFAIRCLMEPSESLTILGVLSLLYLAFTSAFARTIPRSLAAQLGLQLQNEALVRELTQARDAAIASERDKSRFLAAASHDLRQPLHAMGLFVPALQAQLESRQPATDVMRQILERMKMVLAGVGHLLDLLLDMSRLEAGTVEPRRSATHCSAAMHRACASVRAQADARGLRLRVLGSGLWVHTDPDVLHTILLNLVSNAVRYTPRGSVLLTARRRGGSVELAVRDSGIGIPPDDQPRLFEAYFQARNAGHDPTRLRGFGLGLAIVQRLAGLLGTEVTVRSRLGQGSVFRFDLPGCVPPALLPDLPDRPLLAAGQCVLVIDDDEQILVAMSLLLDSWGVAALTARTLAEARTRMAEASVRPSLALLDHHLSHGASPQDNVGRLRSWLAPGVPIVIVTGDTSSQAMRQVAALDVQVWHKPVDPVLLRGLLQPAGPAAD